jgi:hypothetical protein
MRLVRWLIGAGFALAALLFAFLPFVTLGSSQAGSTMRWTWTGWTCLFGGHPALHVDELLYDSRLGRYVSTDVTDAFQSLLGARDNATLLLPQPIFMSAALFVIAGLAGAILLTAPARPLVYAVAGIGGAITLVVAQIHVINVLYHGVLAKVGPPTTAYGFWIVDGLLLALGLAGTVLTARHILAGTPTSAPEAADPAPAESTS